MVDYVLVLTRAVAVLDPNTSETRHVLYDRARAMLIDGLRTKGRTNSDFDLNAEMAAFEAAIQRVEANSIRRASPSQSQPEDEVLDEPVEEYPDRPPLMDRRNPLHIVAALACILVVLAAGLAAYSFWAARNPSVAGSGGADQRSTSSNVEEPAASNSYVYLRQPVYYRTIHPVGTLIVDRLQTFLYVVRPGTSALRYGIGISPECKVLAGLFQVVRKEEWPGWKPPPQTAGDFAADQLKNPLGARALYLSKDHRIHGTDLPATTRQRTPDGCIWLVNDDVIYLYDQTPLESRVVVLN